MHVHLTADAHRLILMDFKQTITMAMEGYIQKMSAMHTLCERPETRLMQHVRVTLDVMKFIHLHRLQLMSA